ncbi:MAG TPA: glycosyltransferase family 39 protein [Candidatus Methanoperedens sp.]|nr:glycosyltransferase family 39 protein [Candidatus Methanoperedens sp.]
MKNANKIIFLLILLLALFFRLWKLDSLPSGLNWDEISHGYNSYSLLKTGQDQWGQSWPIFNFRAYGDFPTAANLYFTMPFIAIFGLNAFSIRLPAAIFGLLFVVFNYLLAKLILKNEKLALFNMLLAALSPWTLFPSRGVFQSNLSQFFFIAGIYYFYKSLLKPKHAYLSSLFFGMSLYSYHNTRIAVPMLLCYFSIYYWKQLKTKIHLFALFLFLVFAIPNLLNLFSPESTARNRWVGIINPNSINLINEERRLFTGPPILNRVVNNKVVYFVFQLSRNYFDLVNPLPIFFQGSANYQFNPPKTGLLFIVLIPFFYVGLFRFRQFFIPFLISLLPAALTVGDFPSIRATIALPFYFLAISYGISFLKNKKIFYLIILIFFLEFASYWSKYLRYNQEYSQNWQYGYQEMVEKIKTNYSDYQKIYITKKYGEAHEFILFYWPWNPKSYQEDLNKNWDFHADWYWVNAFDKFIFINDWEIPSLDLPQNSLLVTSPQNHPKKSIKNIDNINFLNGQAAFELVVNE